MSRTLYGEYGKQETMLFCKEVYCWKDVVLKIQRRSLHRIILKSSKIGCNVHKWFDDPWYLLGVRNLIAVSSVLVFCFGAEFLGVVFDVCMSYPSLLDESFGCISFLVLNKIFCCFKKKTVIRFWRGD